MFLMVCVSEAAVLGRYQTCFENTGNQRLDCRFKVSFLGLTYEIPEICFSFVKDVQVFRLLCDKLTEELCSELTPGQKEKPEAQTFSQNAAANIRINIE